MNVGWDSVWQERLVRAVHVSVEVVVEVAVYFQDDVVDIVDTAADIVVAIVAVGNFFAGLVIAGHHDVVQVFSQLGTLLVDEELHERYAKYLGMR